MIALAVGFLEAFFARRAGKLLDQAGGAAYKAFDDKLSALYGWVRQKFTGKDSAERALRMFEKDPGDEDPRDAFAEALKSVLDSDPQSQGQLGQFVDELKKLRPAGVTIRGLAQADKVAGQQTGVSVEGKLAAGDTVEGTAKAGTVEAGGSQAGVSYRPGT
ncbi:MAG TPA: hypothetical protein VMA95_18895 [Streptosporangiaceae bacterium]|nr:hypothetical protein [Streptosporangiaceae bacterium]